MPAAKKTLSYGLLSVAVRLEVAKISRPTMSNLCVGQPGAQPHDPLPVRQPKVCTECGDITDHDALVKGVKSGQTYTLIDTDELEKAADEFIVKTDALAIVPRPATDFYAKTGQGSTLHWISPVDAGGADHYQLLRRLVEDNPEYAFTLLHTPRSVTSLYVLRVRDGVLLLEQRTREQQLKPAPSVGGTVNDALYGMLTATLDQFVQPYDPAAFEDEYLNTVDRLLAEGKQVSVAGLGVTPATPVLTDDELMAKLQALAGSAA